MKSLRELADIEITRLNGVGPERASALGEAFGIETVLDLLTHYPRRHLDMTRLASMRELRIGDQAWVFGKVLSSNVVRGSARGRGPKARLELRVTDGSGHMKITFFNQPWRQRQFPDGTEAMFFGKVDTFKGTRSMANPEIDLLGSPDLSIRTMYPQSDKKRIYSKDLRELVAQSLRRAGELVDPVPADVLDRFDFVDRTAAVRGIHQPEVWEEIDLARRRLIFDELLRIQLALVLRKRAIERSARGFTHDTDGALVATFVGRLPFELTADQQRVIAEIRADLAKPIPMHRLLQGDVGSGKTVIALAALLTAVEGGHQGAFMAPTEVLAEQHFAGMRELLSDIELGDEDGASLFGSRPLKVELLTNRVGAADRRRILEQLAAGEVDLLVGTHALIQEAVEFKSLGVVVIDEQHRFGVEQRAALRDKGRVRGEGSGEYVDMSPDVLVMTATPIPRTAAMTVYGDLDVSTLTEKPPGRTPITTSWAKTDLDEVAVWAQVREEVGEGRQAYVVCPLIEESDKLEARSAEETYNRLDADELKGLRLGLLHGRMSSAEKDETMKQFRAGRLDVLVATTVIEVGVDVPNATVMVVLDADRFGIAQLHQLRGRVGRGADRSYCHLVSAVETPDALTRLQAMVDSDDGFLLAEVDLEVRGEGTIMAERQKGRNDLKLASLKRDREWVERAREVAFAIVDADPSLRAHEELRDEIALFLDEDDEEFLLKS